MKEVIEFYYNINIESVIEENNVTSFYYDNSLYLFVPFLRTVEEIDDILVASKELASLRIDSMILMFTKENSVILKLGDNYYCLLKIMENYTNDVNIIDIISNNKKTIVKNNKYKNIWGELWSKKIDYFEYQISERGADKNIVLDSFSYYIGLAENAISIVNLKNSEYNYGNNEVMTLSHRRIFYPNIVLNYYNPLSYIFDIEVRDPAEYIKSCFFYDEDAYIELVTYLKSTKLSNYSYNLFFARLLYPSYYFDNYEKAINEEGSEEELIRIISRVDSYEKFLKFAYYEISKYGMIENISWLTN